MGCNCHELLQFDVLAFQCIKGCIPFADFCDPVSYVGSGPDNTDDVSFIINLCLAAIMDPDGVSIWSDSS